MTAADDRGCGPAAPDPAPGPPAIAAGIGVFAVVALADSLVAPLADRVAGSGHSTLWFTAEVGLLQGCGLAALAAASRRRCFAGETARGIAPPAGAALGLAASAACGVWDWALYLAASSHSATEIPAAAVSQWSTLMILLLALADKCSPTPGRTPRRVGARVGWAMGAACAGMLALTASRIPRQSPLLPESVGTAETKGVLLAVAASAVAAVATGGSVIYGEKTAARDRQGHKAAMWHMLTAGAAAKMFGALQLACAAAAAAVGGGGIPAPWHGPAWMAGSIVVGSACVRAGNAHPRIPVAANMVCLATPALGVLWLAIGGLAIPRPGLYLAGVAVLTGSLAAAQWPDRASGGRNAPAR